MANVTLFPKQCFLKAENFKRDLNVPTLNYPFKQALLCKRLQYRPVHVDIPRTCAGRLLGLVATNGLSVAGGGRAVFPALSLLSHSCNPSLEHWVEGTRVVVRPG